MLICRFLLHAADLSNQLRPFEICKTVAFNIYEEYRRQVEEEKRKNLPITEYMKIPNKKSMYKNEIHFSEFVVRPLWDVFVDIFPNLKFIREELVNNINSWKVLFVSEM